MSESASVLPAEQQITRPTARWMSAGVFVATGTLLGVARWLDPSPLGHSTHLQLGLGHCTFLAITGIPCPMCGMTTTFAWMADGQVIRAFETQPFGVVLFTATAAICVLGLVEAIRPRGRWGIVHRVALAHEGRIASAFMIAMCLGWIYKIAAMSV